MIASMAIFAIEDSLVKVASELMPIGQVLIALGFGGAFVFAISAVANGGNLFDSEIVSATMIVRAVCEILGRLFYVLAITLAPLSSATAILQATPIVVMGGAAILFHEKVGIRRWLAICVGLIGVLVILQPGTDSFTLFSLFAVLGMFGFAGRDLATRACSMSIKTSVLGFYGFIAVVVAGFIYLNWTGSTLVSVSFRGGVIVAASVATGVMAYMSLMVAMRIGEVSAVTPFRYTRLLFGVVVGVFVFGEKISVNFWIGCALIVVSGLYVLYRSNPVVVYPEVCNLAFYCSFAIGFGGVNVESEAKAGFSGFSIEC